MESETFPDRASCRKAESAAIKEKKFSARFSASRRRRTARRCELLDRCAPRPFRRADRIPSADRSATARRRSRPRSGSSSARPRCFSQRQQDIRQRRLIGTAPDLQACRTDVKDDRRVLRCFVRCLAHYTSKSHRLVPGTRLAVTLQPTRPPVQRRGGVVLVDTELASALAARSPVGDASRPFGFVRHARELGAARHAPLHGSVQRILTFRLELTKPSTWRLSIVVRCART
jgi:hypothetical protein